MEGLALGSYFMQNNARIGGILSIVAGGFGILGAGMAFFGIYMFRFMFGQSYMYGAFQPPGDIFNFMAIFYAVIGLFLALLGVLAIVGGIFALKKKNWGLALAGAITSAVVFFPCGIAAVIFVTLGQPEFAVSGPALPE